MKLSVVGALGSPAPVREWLRCSLMCTGLALLFPTPAALHPCSSFFLQSLGIHQTTNNIVMRIFWFPWMCGPFSHMHRDPTQDRRCIWCILNQARAEQRFGESHCFVSSHLPRSVLPSIHNGDVMSSLQRHHPAHKSQVSTIPKCPAVPSSCPCRLGTSMA